MYIYNLYIYNILQFIYACMHTFMYNINITIYKILIILIKLTYMEKVCNSYNSPGYNILFYINIFIIYVMWIQLI